MTDLELNRKIAIIFAADVVDYSVKMEENENSAIQALNQTREKVDPLIAKFKGRIFHTAGDSVMAEFKSPTDAVNCAVEIQKELIQRNQKVDLDERMNLRIGINMGDVIAQDDNLFGEGVNIAARLEAKAPSDGILISKNIYELVRSRTDHSFLNLGRQQVKKTSFQAYQVDFGFGKQKVLNRKTQFSFKPIIAVIPLLILILGAVIYFLDEPEQDFQPLDKKNLAFTIPDTPSITVAPFKSLVADSATNYLEKSIVDNIVSVLNGSPALFVVSIQTNEMFKELDPEVRKIAETAGVRYVLNGNYHVVGKDIRVTAQLNDALNGVILWSGKFDSPLDDLFSILDDISNTVFEEVHVEVAGKNRSEMAFFTNNSDYTEYLNCFEIFQYYTPDKNKQAEACVKDLSTLAQSTAPVKFLHGWIYWQRVFIGISTDPQTDISFARKVANKMMSEVNTGEPLVLHGWLDFLEGKYESVYQNALKAIETDPANSSIIPVAASLLRRVARYDEAKAAFAQTMRMNPSPPLYVLLELGFTLTALGEYDEAKAILEATLPRVAREGQIGNVLMDLAVVHMLEGNKEKAKSVCSQAKMQSASFNLDSLLAYESGTIDSTFLAKFSEAAKLACQ